MDLFWIADTPEIRVSLNQCHAAGRRADRHGDDGNCRKRHDEPSDPGLSSSVALPYGRTMPAEVDGVAIVTGTVAANGKELAFVTTASTV